MKAYLENLVRSAISHPHAINLVREYLQARLLGGLQRAGAMTQLAFQGGTCLRFVHGLPRFSEDLDFTLERRGDSYDFRSVLKQLQRELVAEAYAVQVKVSDKKAVHSAFVSLPGLLFELGLSPNSTQVIAVKIEVDTNPPAGAVMETTVLRRHLALHLQHHDRASLLAGKLHAILQRSYVKGRDWFDLFWYLSAPNWPLPNLTLLNNALKQTGWQGSAITGHGWRDAAMERLRELQWDRVLEDLRPFVEHTADLDALSQQNLVRLLEHRAPTRR